MKTKYPFWNTMAMLNLTAVCDPAHRKNTAVVANMHLCYFK